MAILTRHNVNRLAVLSLMLVMLALPGCEDGPAAQMRERMQKDIDRQANYAKRKIRQPKQQPRDEPRAELDIIAQAQRQTEARTRFSGRAEEVAVKKVAAAIHASLELGPTLVVWIVDRTPSAQKIVMQATPAIADFYESTELREAARGEGDPLLTAVVAFDETAEFVLDPPTADFQKIEAALDTIRPSAGGRELPFTAVKQALDKYLSLRTDQRREVLLVVLTDEAGDDPQLVDELVETTRRNALPVYVIGSPAPWGQVNPFAADPKAGDKTKADDSSPKYGPESLFSERVDVQGWMATYSYSVGFQARPNFELIDSGFGPFALERLCRESRGQLFAIRDEASGGRSSYRATGSQYWPTGEEMRFDPGVLAKYAPDCVSETQYKQLLSENRARQALHETAKLPRLKVDDTPQSRFARKNEAQMARSLTQAQQFAAKYSPSVDRLYAAISAGESDRDRLAGARWQAQFDLAAGQILAVKARLDGYNSMIAALKRGKTFQNEASKEWVLEPADTFETESTIRKLAERAKVYLDRVVKEHPGTPWARIAEEELKNPLGWTWKEE